MSKADRISDATAAAAVIAESTKTREVYISFQLLAYKVWTARVDSITCRSTLLPSVSIAGSIPVQPAMPAPLGSEQVAYAHLTHEDVLRARLEGKIDTPTMESMLAHLDGDTIPQAVPKIRDTVSYYG